MNHSVAKKSNALVHAGPGKYDCTEKYFRKIYYSAYNDPQEAQLHYLNMTSQENKDHRPQISRWKRVNPMHDPLAPFFFQLRA